MYIWHYLFCPCINILLSTHNNNYYYYYYIKINAIRFFCISDTRKPMHGVYQNRKSENKPSLFLCNNNNDYFHACFELMCKIKNE